jgi:hypothetical protein
MDSRDNLQRNISRGRSSLLILLVMTLVNIGMILLDSDTYFVCSISIPYLLCYLGKLDFMMEFDFSACLAVSLVVLGVFFAIWMLSKKRPGLLYAALILFIADTLMLLNFSLRAEALAENAVDLLFHAWALWELFQGARCGSKLEQLPEEAAVADAAPVNAPMTGADFLKGAAAAENDEINGINF